MLLARGRESETLPVSEGTVGIFGIALVALSIVGTESVIITFQYSIQTTSCAAVESLGLGNNDFESSCPDDRAVLVLLTVKSKEMQMNLLAVFF